MTFLKIFVVIAFVIINWCVLVFQPAVHSPFVLEKTDFKVAKSYQEPKTTQNINILRLGEVKSNKKIVEVKSNENANKTENREVHIEPSKFYQYASGMRPKETCNIQEIIAKSEVNDAVSSGVAQSTAPKKLTKREETIAWNQWRSDLQNQVMIDSAVEAPFGTLIKYSFRVSKSKTISNIKVSCTNWAYTEKVREALTPVIKSYAGKDILTFPEGSERKYIDFKGAYLIWFETSFSSPNDFNDFERVHRYE